MLTFTNTGNPVYLSDLDPAHHDVRCSIEHGNLDAPDFILSGSMFYAFELKTALPTIQHRSSFTRTSYDRQT